MPIAPFPYMYFSLTGSTNSNKSMEGDLSDAYRDPVYLTFSLITGLGSLAFAVLVFTVAICITDRARIARWLRARCTQMRRLWGSVRQLFARMGSACSRAWTSPFTKGGGGGASKYNGISSVESTTVTCTSSSGVCNTDEES